MYLFGSHEERSERGSVRVEGGRIGKSDGFGAKTTKWRKKKRKRRLNEKYDSSGGLTERDSAIYGVEEKSTFRKCTLCPHPALSAGKTTEKYKRNETKRNIPPPTRHKVSHSITKCNLYSKNS